MALTTRYGTAVRSSYTPLERLTDELLGNHHAAECLRLADDYIQMYHRTGDKFILPREHAKLRPLIEAYADDLEGLVHYVLGVRDTLSQDSVAHAELHKLYRTVSTRLLQQERRARINAAVDKAVSMAEGPVSYDTKFAWARRIEQEWGRRRLDFMAELRRKTKRNRLSVDERSEALAQFWKNIDWEIKRGELPPMEE